MVNIRESLLRLSNRHEFESNGNGRTRNGKEFEKPPEIDTKDALLYTLVHAGYFTRMQVGIVSKRIAENIHQGTYSTIADLMTIAKMSRAGAAKTDPFLKAAVLAYDKQDIFTDEELEKAGELLPPISISGNIRRPRSRFVDVLAGSGHERAVLKDLYSLSSFGLLLIDRHVSPGKTEDIGEATLEETFEPTNAANGYIKSLKIILRQHKLSPDTLILVKRNKENASYGSRARKNHGNGMA